jgi:outer membrane lipoprotein-sorting protein
MKANVKAIQFAAGLLCGLLTATAWAVSVPEKASDLILKMQRDTPPDEVAEFSMQLIDADGKVSNRTGVFSQKQKTAGSLDDLKLVRFHSPPEMNGSGVLTIENGQNSDDQWMYLPAYHTSRKIPSSNMADRYMGTDFFYEDLTDVKIDKERFTYIGEETVDGRLYVKVEQVPFDEKTKRESAYGRVVTWVDPERLVSVRTDLYDKEGKQIKLYELSKPVQVSGHWRWDEARMTDLRSNHKTIIIYKSRKLNQGLEDAMFTVRRLERGK